MTSSQNVQHCDFLKCSQLNCQLWLNIKQNKACPEYFFQLIQMEYVIYWKHIFCISIVILGNISKKTSVMGLFIVNNKNNNNIFSSYSDDPKFTKATIKQAKYKTVQ